MASKVAKHPVSSLQLFGDFKPTSDVVVVYSKKAGDAIWAYEAEYKGKKQFHIRGVYIMDGEEEWRPGRGVVFPMDKPEAFAEIREALLAAIPGAPKVKTAAKKAA